MRAFDAGQQGLSVIQHGVRIEALCIQPGARAVASVLRTDLGDVAGLPLHSGASGWLQAQPVHRTTGAARVQVLALQQRPRLILGRAPVGQFTGAATELPQQLLPMAQRGRIGVVDFDRIEQRMRTMLAQPLVQLVAESTEVAIAAIAQREHAVVQVLHRRWRGHCPAQERQRMVGRVALTGGAGDEQRALAGRQQCCVHLMQSAHTHRHAGTTQGLGTAFGQFAGETGLAGPDQQDRRGIARWGVVTRAATPPQRGTGQRIQRRSDQRDLRLPCRRRTLPPGLAQMQAQQRPPDQRQQKQDQSVAEPRARRTCAHASCSSSRRWKALLRNSRGPSAVRCR